MTTSLGGGKNTSLRMHVKNGTASTIKRGTVVSFSSVAANNPAVSFLDGTQNRDYGTGTERQTEIPYITVGLAPADSTTPGGSGRLGVTAADIPAGGYGEIITYGLALVYYISGATVGEVVTNSAAGLAIDAANATHKNPWGIALETATLTTQPYWVFVNFFPGVGSATAFMGKAY